jgi:hypothetical protein
LNRRENSVYCCKENWQLPVVVRRDKTKKMSSKINENELISFKRVERMERAPARNLKFSHQLEN